MQVLTAQEELDSVAGGSFASGLLVTGEVADGAAFGAVIGGPVGAVLGAAIGYSIAYTVENW